MLRMSTSGDLIFCCCLQLEVNYCFMKNADTWMGTRIVRFQKQLLCKLCHNKKVNLLANVKHNLPNNCYRLLRHQHALDSLIRLRAKEERWNEWDLLKIFQKTTCSDSHPVFKTFCPAFHLILQFLKKCFDNLGRNRNWTYFPNV